MANYLPNGDNCTVLFAEAQFKPKNVPNARFRTMGIVDRIDWTPEVETSDKTWKGEVVKTKTTSKSATLALVMGEMTWDNFKAAFMAGEADLTQTAGAVAGSATDVAAGESIELGKFGVTGLVLTDGTDDLVENEDYRAYDTATDHVLLLKPFATVTWSGTAPVIEAGDRKVLSMLSEDNGIAGEFRFVGENTEGQRIMLDNIVAELRPDGAVTISSDSTDFQTVSLNGKVIRNNVNAAFPYGRVVPLNNL